MSINVNLRHLENNDLQLDGELDVSKLDLAVTDEAVSISKPLRYRLSCQELDGAILVQGDLELALDCVCVRCLREFTYNLQIDNYSLHLPLEGEDAVQVNNDCVDLTPFLREDILLEFPQHPLCDPECRGLAGNKSGIASNVSSTGNPVIGSSAWAELNKLKL
jgi:uncharacterized metal-binding protein YceD (DUF177 family)